MFNLLSNVMLMNWYIVYVENAKKTTAHSLDMPAAYTLHNSMKLFFSVEVRIRYNAGLMF